MEIDVKLFYTHYQINYFSYKQSSLEFLIDNYSKTKAKELLFNYKDNDYLNSIRCDIRQTYFQAIETVFELFYALIPEKGGKIDGNPIEIIARAKFPYEKITEISKSKSKLDILDKQLEYGGIKTSLGEFLFYFGQYTNKDLKGDISLSLTAIKHLLFLLAIDFSDRREYNSYKHGLRIIPAWKEMKIIDAETQENYISFDLSNAVTFFTFDNKKNETAYRTKVLDSNRDIRMTHLCTMLIWNMIKFREIVINKKEKDKDYKYEIPLFGVDEINKAAETNVRIQDIVYSKIDK